jgi:UDP-glucuronate decarboxylase
MRRCPDIRKARLQLGYEPRVELEEGLRRFLSWTDRVYIGQA